VAVDEVASVGSLLGFLVGCGLVGLMALEWGDHWRFVDRLMLAGIVRFATARGCSPKAYPMWVAALLFIFMGST